MKRYLLSLIPLASLAMGFTADGADWITAPSTYSHDPQTGERVDQYTPIGPVYTFARQDFMRSGYRHTRSALQAGRSIDHMHIIEEWGRPVRPYGEWQRPFRPYSVPYSMWGPPFAGLGFPLAPFPYRNPHAGPHPPMQPGPPPAGAGQPQFPNGAPGPSHPGGPWSPGQSPRNQTPPADF